MDKNLLLQNLENANFKLKEARLNLEDYSIRINQADVN